MADSFVDISNQALIKIGASTIMDFAPTEDSKAAKLCGLVYKRARDYVLRNHPWNCATKRVNLSPDVIVPAYGYDAQFALPADCLRVLLVNQLKDFKVEGRFVLCNESSIDLKYITRIEDATLIDEMCADAIACRIAYEISYAMTESSQLKKDMYDQYRDCLRKAKFVDATEDPSQEFISDAWFQARISGSTFGPGNT
jgi:hypothetical protein